MNKKVELLLPAGSIEKLEYAIRYGADAVYLGIVDFSLRSMRKGKLITADNLKTAVDLAHSLNAKTYLTLNIFAYDDDIKNLEKQIEKISQSNVDAVIVSDFGILNLVKKYMPKTDIHISTQTNILNSEAVKFWKDQGSTRVILARELSLLQIENIRKNVPDIELEVFVHGSQCMSYSGRCLLSDYMTDGERKANLGNCAQPCRWSYKLVEETRPNQYYEIVQDNRGSHILSTKDLALINYIPKLIDIGVDSFKIEGRTKSLYYVSAIARAYRMAIDSYLKGLGMDQQYLIDEILKIGNRGYTTGFYIDGNNSQGYSYDISKGLAGADFLCEFIEQKDNLHKVVIKNKILKNDKIEIITPSNSFLVTVKNILNDKNESVEIANTNDVVYLEFDLDIENSKYGLGRTIGIKNNDT